MSDGESEGRKDRPYWLPVIIATIFWAWLTYLYFTPEAVDRTMFTFDTWKNIGYLLTVVMLTWLFIWKITLNTEVVTETAVVEAPEEAQGRRMKAQAKGEDEEEPEERAPPKKRPKRVVVKEPSAAAVAAAAAAAAEDDEDLDDILTPKELIWDDQEEPEDLPRVIEWEKKEPGGVYSDTLIRVDENLVLNLRTILGKVCHNCEELEDCRRRIAGKVDERIFLWNFECKDGLKRELHKARKKREREEEKAEAAKEMVEGKAASNKGKTTPKKKTAARGSTSGRKTKTAKKKTASSSAKKESAEKDEK